MRSPRNSWRPPTWAWYRVRNPIFFPSRWISTRRSRPPVTFSTDTSVSSASSERASSTNLSAVASVRPLTNSRAHALRLRGLGGISTRPTPRTTTLPSCTIAGTPGGAERWPRPPGFAVQAPARVPRGLWHGDGFAAARDGLACRTADGRGWPPPADRPHHLPPHPERMVRVRQATGLPRAVGKEAKRRLGDLSHVLSPDRDRHATARSLDRQRGIEPGECCARPPLEEFGRALGPGLPGRMAWQRRSPATLGFPFRFHDQCRTDSHSAASGARHPAVVSRCGHYGADFRGALLGLRPGLLRDLGAAIGL